MCMTVEEMKIKLKGKTDTLAFKVIAHELMPGELIEYMDGPLFDLCRFANEMVASTNGGKTFRLHRTKDGREIIVLNDEMKRLYPQFQAK